MEDHLVRAPAPGPDDGQNQLRNLQQWVCELLIKNQQLRIRLASATENNLGHDASTFVES